MRIKRIDKTIGSCGCSVPERRSGGSCGSRQETWIGRLKVRRRTSSIGYKKWAPGEWTPSQAKVDRTELINYQQVLLLPLLF